MRHTIIVSILISMLLVLQLNAQTNTVQKFSLQEAVEYAKKYNYTLKNNALEVLAAQKKVNEVLAMGLPNVSASGTFMNNLQVPTQSLPNFLKPTFVGSAMGQAEAAYRQQNPNATPQEIENVRNQAAAAVSKEIPDVINAGFGRPYSLTANLDATQLLFDGGFLMGVKASKEFVNISKINLKRNEVETEVSVSKTYYSILLIKTNLELIDANLEALSKTKYDLEKIAQNGLMDKIEYDRIALQYSMLELQRDKLKDDSKVLLMVLKLQIGLNVTDEIELTDDLLKMYESSKNNLISLKGDVTNRLEYQALSQAIRLNQLDKKRYQFGYVPSLVAFFTHQESSFGEKIGDIGSKWFPGTYWGLKLTVPIFDGLKKNALIQQSSINIKKAENDRRVLENAIAQETYKARTTYERASKQIAIQKKNFDLAQEIYNRTQLKYNNGLGSSLDLANALKDLETSRTSYLTTLYDYFVAQLDLRKATGDLNK
ncbi:MAG: TolC family protein [Bacteroidia bacterium]|nr:TolC family protein [Bacteroidia bacterium]MCC7532976.1 TolC family protein [Bacteroidia bacterium]